MLTAKGAEESKNSVYRAVNTCSIILYGSFPYRDI
jgi:hypothetical protein